MFNTGNDPSTPELPEHRNSDQPSNIRSFAPIMRMRPEENLSQPALAMIFPIVTEVTGPPGSVMNRYGLGYCLGRFYWTDFVQTASLSPRKDGGEA